MESGISKWVYRDICQDVCPWNVRFASSLREPAIAPREAIARKDARTLARELLAMLQEEFSRAFSKSPMKRAKLRGLKRDAAVVLGNVGSSEDVMLLEHVQREERDEMLREHAAWALAQLSRAPSPVTAAAGDELEPSPAETSARLESGTPSP